MHRVLLSMVVVLAVGCSGGSGDEGAAPPAATLSLSELAGRAVETTYSSVPPPEAPITSVYRALGEAVESGELSPMDADRALMPLIWGESAAVPDAYRAEGADAGVPDMALFWLLQRVGSYPEEVQQEIRAWLPAERDAGVADAGGSWNPFAPAVAYAAAPPFDESCAGSVLGDEFFNLGEVGVTVGGTSARLAVCGPSGASSTLAQTVLGQASSAMAAMDTFFQGGSNLGSRQPELRVYLHDGPLPLSKADSSSHGYMASCRDMGINMALPRCELEATVVHEVFHCLHMQSQGFQVSWVHDDVIQSNVHRGSWYGRVPDWVAEGAATWAEDRFDIGEQDNAEWGAHLGMSEVPFEALAERVYSGGVFFNFLQQHAGGDDAVRRVLDLFAISEDGNVGGPVGGPDFDRIEQLQGWPEAWLDFAESFSGFEPLFDNDRPRLTDNPVFPYQEQSNCVSSWTLGQESVGRRTPLEPYQARIFELNIPPAAIQYEILDVQGESQFIDVGFTSDLVQRIEANEARVIAVLRTFEGDRVEDWSERWRSEAGGSEPIRGPVDQLPEERTEGRLRVCLTDEAIDCYNRAPREIHRGLYEIDLIIANAGASPDEAVGGSLVLLPSSMPGWRAERIKMSPGFREDE